MKRRRGGNRIYGFERLLLVLLLASVTSIFAGLNCLAADIPAGYASGTTYYVQDTIESWSELEGLLNDYNTIKLNKAYIHTNDISELAHLGEASGLSLIAKIDAALPLEMYPPLILPEYNAATDSFISSKNVKTTTSPSIVWGYTWAADLNYIYDGTGSRTVAVVHEIQDENGVRLLQYASNTSSYSSVDPAENLVYLDSFAYPQDNPVRAAVVYPGVIHGYMTRRGTPTNEYSIGLEYYYEINPSFLAGVKLDIDPVILGKAFVEMKNTDNQPVAGAGFGIYEDEGCTRAARYYAGGSWHDAIDLLSGSDGRTQEVYMMPGEYYVKQLSAATSYELNSEIEALCVEPLSLNLSIAESSGEGKSVMLADEEIVLEPELQLNCRNTMSFANIGDYTEQKSAASYGDVVFVKGGGNHLEFTQPADVEELEGFSHIGGEGYRVKAGSINQSFASLSEAISYVNAELIDNYGIDAAAARAEIVISGVGANIYLDEDNVGSASLSAVEESDIPVTGLETGALGTAMRLIIIILVLGLSFCIRMR